MRKRNGFSLVEVLMLFAALSVILAVTAPILTKNSKNLPQKMAHGFYQCYRDENGDLHEELYNSFRRIDKNGNNTVAECKFEPQEAATMYRITLIGGGTGGFSYGAVTESTTAFNSTYDITRSDDHYITPEHMYRYLKDDELASLFQNAQMSICSPYAGDGGRSCGEEQTYYPAKYLYCAGDRKKEPTEDEIRKICVEEDLDEDACQGRIEAEITNFNREYPNYLQAEEQIKKIQSYPLTYEAVETGVTITFDDLCKQAGYTANTELESPNTISQYGASGGLGYKVSYTYKLVGDKGSFETYEDYLEAVAQAYTKGSCLESSCSDFVEGTSKISDGKACSKKIGSTTYSYYPIPHGVLAQQGNNPNFDIRSEDGGNAVGYAAVRWIDPITKKTTYATTYPLATGGTAGRVDLVDNKWTSSGGKSGTSSGGKLTCNDSIPQANIVTNRMVKYYDIGRPGLPAKMSTFTRFDIGKETCKIYVGQGTKAYKKTDIQVQNDAEKISKLVTTTFSCQGVYQTAKGGEERLASAAVDFSGRNASDSSDTLTYIPNELEEPYKSYLVEAVTPITYPSYKYPNIWLKHISQPKNSSNSPIIFGKAGTGSIMYDACTWPQGNQVNKVGSKTKTIYFGGDKQEAEHKGEWRACTSDDYTGKDGSTKVTAGDGAGGAVFIRW